MKEQSVNIGVNAALVIAVVMVLAALQTMLPGLPGSGLKAPLVVFAGVYWMLFRDAWTGYLGALWAGAVMDGLGGVGWGAGMMMMAGLCWVARSLKEVSGVWGTIPGCGLACAVAGAGMVMAQGALNGGLASVGWQRVFVGTVEIFIASGVAGILVCGCLWGLDVWLGNFKVMEEADDVSWSGAD